VEGTWVIAAAGGLGSRVRSSAGTVWDRVMIRHRLNCDPGLEINPRQARSIERDHDKAFCARFPMLEGVEMQYRWGGRLCRSTNHVQVIGQLDEGLYSACCQNGLGTAKGTLAGILAAELAMGVPSSALDRALNADMPKRLPPKFLTKIGANLRIRTGELRAGSEF